MFVSVCLFVRVRTPWWNLCWPSEPLIAVISRPVGEEEASGCRVAPLACEAAENTQTQKNKKAATNTHTQELWNTHTYTRRFNIHPREDLITQRHTASACACTRLRLHQINSFSLFNSLLVSSFFFNIYIYIRSHVSPSLKKGNKTSAHYASIGRLTPPIKRLSFLWVCDNSWRSDMRFYGLTSKSNPRGGGGAGWRGRGVGEAKVAEGLMCSNWAATRWASPGWRPS